MAPECRPYLTFGKRPPAPPPEHVPASRERIPPQPSVPGGPLGGLELGVWGRGVEGEKLGPGVEADACRPRILKITEISEHLGPIW